MLTNRLKRLEADGMLERRAYSERPRRYAYHLTDKGEAFAPVLLALRAWGETWCKEPGEEVAVRQIHTACGREVGLSGTVCEGCGKPFTTNDASSKRRTPLTASHRISSVHFSPITSSVRWTGQFSVLASSHSIPPSHGT